jgi:hypothetical protein
MNARLLIHTLHSEFPINDKKGAAGQNYGQQKHVEVFGLETIRGQLGAFERN